MRYISAPVRLYDSLGHGLRMSLCREISHECLAVSERGVGMAGFIRIVRLTGDFRFFRRCRLFRFGLGRVVGEHAAIAVSEKNKSGITSNFFHCRTFVVS